VSKFYRTDESLIVFSFVQDKSRSMSSFLTDIKLAGAGQNSIFVDWINRQQGFERLEQYSDEENESLNDHAEDDSANEIDHGTTTASSYSKSISKLQG
jgi:hypothetical protein